MIDAAGLAGLGYQGLYRKRRALARRRWGRRRKRVDQAALDRLFADAPHVGSLHVVQPGSPYAPSDACVLTPSGTAPRNVEE